MKNEVGLTYNPLKITWLEGQPQSSTVFADGTIHPHISQVTPIQTAFILLLKYNFILHVLECCQHIPYISDLEGILFSDLF